MDFGLARPVDPKPPAAQGAPRKHTPCTSSSSCSPSCETSVGGDPTAVPSQADDNPAAGASEHQGALQPVVYELESHGASGPTSSDSSSGWAAISSSRDSSSSCENGGQQLGGSPGAEKPEQSAPAVDSARVWRSLGVGTASYSSPEQLLQGVAHAACDMFPLGLLAFELFHTFGSAMERAKLFAQLRTESIPGEFMRHWPEIASLMSRLLSHSPETRPLCTEVRGQLQELQLVWNRQEQADSQHAAAWAAAAPVSDAPPQPPPTLSRLSPPQPASQLSSHLSSPLLPSTLPSTPTTSPLLLAGQPPPAPLPYLSPLLSAPPGPPQSVSPLTLPPPPPPPLPPSSLPQPLPLSLEQSVPPPLPPSLTPSQPPSTVQPEYMARVQTELEILTRELQREEVERR